MKVVFKHLVSFSIFLFLPLLSAQTSPSYCSASSPCAGLSWSNGTDITPSISTNSSGVETSGPAVAVFMRCTVTATQSCAVANGVLATPSAWNAVSVTNGQSLNETSNIGGPFYDTNVSYNTTYSYTLSLTWTGSLGGVASSYAIPFQLTFSAAPTTTPSTPTGIVATPII
jgi:hypothetical protein